MGSCLMGWLCAIRGHYLVVTGQCFLPNSNWFLRFTYACNTCCYRTYC